ncbi:MAG: protein kinase, partial [Pseudomonadota bacterium]
GAGNILARSDRPQAIGQNMSGKTSFFDDALAGKSGRGYFLSQGRLMQIVTEPIFDNVATDVVRGTVALAYEFSGEMANEIVSLTFSEIGFFSFTRDQQRQVDGVNSIYITDDDLKTSLNSYFQQSDTPWRPIFDGQSVIHKFQAMLNNQNYFAIARPVRNDDSDPLGFIITLRSSADLLKPFTRIQNTVLVIGGICLIIAFILAGFVSFRISRPIVKLMSVTKGIQEGVFPEKSSAPKASDEIGMLYRAVVDMGNNLKEKAELENYLAQMSNELNLNTPLSGDVLNPDAALASTYTDTDLGESPIAKGILIGDRYEVLELIGRGAMGLVYLVQDRDLDEKAALKLLPHDLFNKSNAVSIKEEIRLARRITHRNILRTFDMGNWQNYTYISMEYVAGYDLDQLLKRSGSQDKYIAILMGRQICSAMNAAHEEGVIHLDLKPGNMMVNQQGILKIMDFGLARSIANKGGKSVARNSMQLMGTPRFMAPEQFLNEEIDHRTDIYSIGIILYTLITGSPPFSHNDYMKLAEMHVHHELPKMQGADIESLEKIIQKATEKDPDARYQSVREMLDQLSRV